MEGLRDREEKGERRKEKGEGRREKGEGRREKGEREHTFLKINLRKSTFNICVHMREKPFESWFAARQGCSKNIISFQIYYLCSL
jgi:hypothetical protein